MMMMTMILWDSQAMSHFNKLMMLFRFQFVPPVDTGGLQVHINIMMLIRVVLLTLVVVMIGSAGDASSGAVVC